MLLPRRLVRSIVYTFGLFLFLSGVLFVANKHDYINIHQYIPYYLAPSFFQPPSDLYIIDILINKCFKFNSKNPYCGMPKDSDGESGDLGAFGNWIKIEKDLSLGSSYFHKQFLSYKILKNEAFQNGQLDDSFGGDVISDIAVYNQKIDGKIPGNKLKLPKKVLDEFRRNDVYDDEDQEIYESQKVTGEVYKEDSHNYKASIGNKAMQEQIEQKEKEEREKEQKEKEKADEIKQLEQNEAMEEEKGMQGSEPDKEDEEETEEKESEKEKEEGTNDVKTPEPESDKEEDLPGASEKKENLVISKRKVETSLDSLNIVYEVPSEEEVQASGWRYKGYGIWCKYESYLTRKGLTGIDVLYGKDAVDPRPNWNFLGKNPLDVDSSPGREPYLSFRRGNKVDYKSADYQKRLQVSKDGKFKILQVADLHFSTGVGKCRDPSPSETGKGCEADPRTLKFLEKVLDIEKPDLVVLTGDQIFGDESPDSETSLFKAVNPFIKRKIPFAATLGNHDDEGSISRNEMMSLISNLPYSLASNGPEEVAGFGNYVVNILPNGKSKGTSILLYFLDSHKYSPNPKVNPGYDWLKESQIKFVEREYGSFKTQIKSSNQKHLSMAFFHIPLPEFRNLNQPFIGEKKEGITAPKYNTHARKVFGDIGVKAVSVGHDHCNDYCLQDIEDPNSVDPNKIWLCYGGGVGEGGYGGYGGYIRRLRSFELDVENGEMKTWKRLESEPEKKFDEQIIATKGLVVNF